MIGIIMFFAALFLLLLGYPVAFTLAGTALAFERVTVEVVDRSGTRAPHSGGVDVEGLDISM